LISRAIRFGLTGLLTTSIAYILFIWMMQILASHRSAAVISWIGSLLVGFVANRRFTFGFVGSRRRGRHFGLFLAGAVLQLLVALAGYELLIGQLGLSPTPAFLANAVLTTSFSFAWLNAVAFRF
jgi:putative flippase GtrA